ncbi:MAG: hypothetical protein JWR55_699 [Aeromicrobium sp.]|jgi:flavin reductase (DIM6/NTAB) family NADH-FMN oxidoreductase RutF|nr:hypothetical protein [Aeromicrobium sp.]
MMSPTLPGSIPSESAPSIDAVTFRSVMAELPAAVSIVTTLAADGSLHGATVSAVTSLSLDPAMLLVCLDLGSDTLAALDVGRHFLVHIAADGQQGHVHRFARKGTEKFEGDHWAPGMFGQPQIDGSSITFACVADELVSAGDHAIVLGRIVDTEHEPDLTPIIYRRRQLIAAPAA